MDNSNSLGAKANTATDRNQEPSVDIELRVRTDQGVYHVNWDNEAAVSTW